MYILRITNVREKKSKPALLTTEIVKISYIFVDCLKFTPDVFLRLHFLYLKESIFETGENIFCFTSKALFFLEILKF